MKCLERTRRKRAIEEPYSVAHDGRLLITELELLRDLEEQEGKAKEANVTHKQGAADPKLEKER